jgi:hypothetical protein
MAVLSGLNTLRLIAAILPALVIVGGKQAHPKYNRSHPKLLDEQS